MGKPRYGFMQFSGLIRFVFLHLRLNFLALLVKITFIASSLISGANLKWQGSVNLPFDFMLANKTARVLRLHCLHLLERKKKNTLHVTYEVNCVFDKNTKFLIIILENQLLPLHQISPRKFQSSTTSFTVTFVAPIGTSSTVHVANIEKHTKKP